MGGCGVQTQNDSTSIGLALWLLAPAKYRESRPNKVRRHRVSPNLTSFCSCPGENGYSSNHWAVEFKNLGSFQICQSSHLHTDSLRLTLKNRIGETLPWRPDTLLMLQNWIISCRLPVWELCLEMSSETALQPLLLEEPSNTQGKAAATQIIVLTEKIKKCLAVATHRLLMRRSRAGWRKKWPRGGRAKGKMIIRSDFDPSTSFTPGSTVKIEF